MIYKIDLEGKCKVTLEVEADNKAGALFTLKYLTNVRTTYSK